MGNESKTDNREHILRPDFGDADTVQRCTTEGCEAWVKGGTIKGVDKPCPWVGRSEESN